MPILGDATVIAGRLSRSTSNALRVQLTTPDGTELAHALQTGGAAVLFGFKNGGKSDYTLSSAAGEEFRIAVAGTTTITTQDRPVGRIVPANGAVLAVVQPHTGFKADNAWHHRILSPAGQELGVLSLMRAHIGWRDIEEEAYQLLLNYNVTSLKAPSYGALLKLSAPVPSQLGDVLAAACVDFSVLP